MGLGERCDEIVRLIDETLDALGQDGGGPRTDATVRVLRPAAGRLGERRTGNPVAGSGDTLARPDPDERAVAGV